MTRKIRCMHSDDNGASPRSAGSIGWGLMCVAACVLFFQTGSLAEETGASVEIPLSHLDVEQAVATVTVLPDRRMSVHVLLELCQSARTDEYSREIQDLSEEMKKWCRMMERLVTKYASPPTQQLRTQGYVISIPVREQHGSVSAATWTTQTLDEAIAFVELLTSGQLKSVRVSPSAPWLPNGDRPCSECPINALVFRAANIKEKRNFLEQHLNRESKP